MNVAGARTSAASPRRREIIGRFCIPSSRMQQREDMNETPELLVTNEG
jgi:hypothetical protein